MPRIRPRLMAAGLLAAFCLCLCLAGTAAAQVDFSQVAARLPRLKTLALLEFAEPLGVDRLVKLLNLGAVPQGGDLLDPLGETRAVFFTRAGNLAGIEASGLAQKVTPLDRFKMAGLYRVHFRLAEKDFQGPLRFKVSTPKDGFGKKLIHIEDHVIPSLPARVETDTGGNRWLVVEDAQAIPGRDYKFDFYFVYQVDMATLLDHALGMVPASAGGPPPLSDSAWEFTQPSAKMDSTLPKVTELAGEIFNGETSARGLYRRLHQYIKKNIPYDHVKRARFFGGKMVYQSMADMYDPPEATLDRKVGACPEVSVLETALLRAAGLAARTAGRWGHFYTEIFVPGHGWQSTSVTPTGIPLVVDVDRWHLPFVSWQPAVSVQTTLWTGAVKVDSGDRHD